MSTKHNPNLKTLGKRTAYLFTTLNDRSQSTFTLEEVEEITGLSPKLASNLIRKAATRGLVTRLKRGLFAMIPAEMGSAVEFFGNRYVVARRLAGEAPCYISHASAMEIHRLVTQPQFVVLASCTKRIPRVTLHGNEFRFVLIQPSHFFGTMKHWVTKQEFVEVSDLERTILDGLRLPEYCGGVTEVAKGLWMRRQDMNSATLVDYALRLGVGAVVRRLGYLLDLYEMADEDELGRLRKSLTPAYAPLDPMMPKEGPHLSRWRLQLNISPEELKRVRET